MTIQYNLSLPTVLNIAQPGPARFSASTPTEGFGEYQDFSTSDLPSFQTAQKTRSIVLGALTAAGGIAYLLGAIYFPPLFLLAPVVVPALGYLGVRSYWKHQAARFYFPPTLLDGIKPQDLQAPRTGELIRENGSALVLSDAKESKKYKLDLIRAAQQSLFLSCYMGEEAMDEALDAIKARMAEKQDLKVFLFGSDHFLTEENKKRVEALRQAHPERFFDVLHPEIDLNVHPSGGSLKLSTDHIKLTSIDQGAYTIIGGCALRPFWTDFTGTEHLEKNHDTYDVFHNPLEAKGFRDMDFAIKSEGKKAGYTAFCEGAKLMLRYAHLMDPAKAQKLKTALASTLRTPAMNTQVPSFDNRPEKTTGFDIKLYATGSEHTKNSYLHAMIDLIDNAQEKITVAHMYFHPPQEFIDALKRAAARGVKIDIIGNAKDKEAPRAHRFFVDLGQDTYRQLFEAEGHRNINIYEFYRANTTYHKKVMVVDGRYTAFGSSNLGTKSLAENPADYEFNGIADSRSIAARTMEVVNQDKSLSLPVDPSKAKNPSWDTKILSRFQDFVMTHIL